MSRSMNASGSSRCLETEPEASSGEVRRRKTAAKLVASETEGNLIAKSFYNLDERFWSVDEFYSRKFFELGKGNKIVKTFTKLVNVTSDEALWFGIPLLGLFLNFLVLIPFNSGFRAILDVNAIEFERSGFTKISLETFATACITVVFEQLFKCIFRRPRPKYIAKKKAGPWAVYGEWWSFPSGHTIRGFYFYHWILHSRIIRDNTAFDLDKMSYVWQPLLLWSGSVGVARVTSGKHHLVDVLIGALIGYCFGHLIECDLPLQILYAIKAVGEVWIAIQFWFILIEPELVKAKVNSKLISLLFYTFYAPIVLLWAFHISALYVDLKSNLGG
eukprot:CAMPEP_0204838800 /NCGR_PEP_ID=MMETSP1346-20131115/31939_1 /ASSEMBLY_ACC=CAM_ASM_000771 /TAXON_ID=215587 /ORGANISM="Aplanochytrium stocchinoi, Strain GSBS06" /LENGTH=330 /DNA_ID=CAMNT_0051975053 /DNA_START=70 /DNA_END=1062 /DNA_ORIENTATION=-